jgi:hypothetical protein
MRGQQRSRFRRLLVGEALEHRIVLTYGAPALISQAESGLAAANNYTSFQTEQSLSADGRFLVFSSDASDIVSGDSNGYRDVFLRDLRLGTVTLISRNAVGETANGSNDEAVISADGRYVAFQSTATNLDVTGTNSVTGYQNIFRWERASNKLTLVSQNAIADDGGDNSSYYPSINDDGSRIAYATYASNFVSGVSDDNNDLDVYMRDLTSQSTALVSHAAGAPLTAGDGDSSQPKISRDGARVTYYSRASDLQSGASDANSTYDLVSYLVSAGTNQYVSLETTAASTGNGDSSRTEHSLSADGRYEVFSSEASDLVPGDTNGYSDVFIRDLQTGAVTLVSQGQGGLAADWYSSDAVISSNGNFVAFVSAASNLEVTSGPNPSNFTQNVFLWERATGALRLVSVNAAGDDGGNNSSYEPSISGDGSLVAFSTYASNLQANVTDDNGNLDIYLFRASTGAAVLVSRSTSSSPASIIAGNNVSTNPRLSRDGSRVVYLSYAGDLQAGVQDINSQYDLVSYLVDTGDNQYVSVQVDAPGSASQASTRTDHSLSADGNYEVFTSRANDLVLNDTNNMSDVFLRNLQTGEITLVSRTVGGAAATYHSNQAVISADGNFVAFVSAATNLDVTGTNDTQGNWNVYRWERLTGELRLVTVNAADDNGGDNTSGEPSISGNGRWISYASDAGNLLASLTDNNSSRDIYVRDMGDASALPAIIPSTALVSHTASSITTTGNWYSSSPRVSRDGTHIVYSSYSSDLQSGVSDANNQADLVSYTISSGANQYVSVESSAPSTVNRGSSRTDRSLSADGVYEVFTSDASDLVPGDSNASSDVFLRNLQTGEVTLVSRGVSGPANGSSFEAVISADGEYVAFLSSATDLDVTGTGPDSSVYWSNVYRWKRADGELELVSRNAGEDNAANYYSYEPSISGDGNLVAFSTSADDLVSGVTDGNGDVDVYLRDVSAQTTVLVSHTDGAATTTGNWDSRSPQVSRDGSHVVYRSRAANLQSTVSDTNSVYDLVSFDVSGATNQYLSVETAVATLGNAGSSRSEHSLSADGRYEVFSSDASDLVPEDGNDTADVFLRDLLTGVVTLVSHDVNGFAANGASNEAVISADGKYVTFVSNANNLDIADPSLTAGSYWTNIYRWSREADTLELVSLNATGTYASNYYSYGPSISGDGSRIAFATSAGDLVAGISDGNGDLDVYVRDMNTATTSLVSVSAASSTTTAAGRSEFPQVSRDGSTVVFQSLASDLDASVTDSNSQWDVFAFDVSGSSISTLSVDAGGTATADAGILYGEVSISDDGQVVAFSSSSTNLDPLDGNSAQDVFVRAAGVTSLVSIDSTGTGAGDGPSGRPSISGNGDIVAFQTYASNLGTLSNGQLQVVVRDRLLLTTALVSVNSDGSAVGNDASQNARISHDGNTVAFESFATDLDGTISSDANGDVDVFMRDWNAPSPVTRLLSRSTSAGVAGNLRANQPELSDDGSIVVFVSVSSDLVSLADVNGASADIFVYDGSSLSAVTVKGSGTYTGRAGTLDGFAVSDTGEVVAFASSSPGLVADLNAISGNSQVYVRDLSNPLAPITERISVDADSTYADAPAQTPSLSGDGRYVAFESYAGNLGSVANNGNWQIYVRDRDTATTTLISIDAAGTAVGDSTSLNARISHDGTKVAFESLATNLDAAITADNNSQYDIFLRNWQNAGAVNQLLSRKAGATVAGNYSSSQPEMSDDGLRVVFNSASTDLVSGIADVNGNAIDLFAYDGTSLALVTAKGTGVFTGSTGIGAGFDLSDNGQFVVFSSTSKGIVADVNGSPHYEQVYWRDLNAQYTERISVNSIADFADYPANSPSISGDGRYVAFQSYASNLSPLANNGNWQVYVRDRATGPGSATTTLISQAAGSAGDSYSLNPSISHDGQWIAFESAAANLDPAGVTDNGHTDTFLQQWASPGPLLLLSRQAGASAGGNQNSTRAELSDTGNRVVFSSAASDLLAGYTDANGVGEDIFAFGNTGLQLVSLKLASLLTGDQGVAADFDISDTGELVAFTSSSQGLVLDLAGNPVYSQVYVRNTTTGITERISLDSDSNFADYPAQRPSISGNGSFVSFESYANNLGPIANNGNWQVYVRDRVAVTISLLSVDSSGTGVGQGSSQNARLSNDGLTVVFESDASALDGSITADGNAARDVFMRDWKSALPVTTLLSRAAGTNVAANRASYQPEPSDNGSRIVFASNASNLVAGVADANGANQDVFAYSASGATVVSAKGAGLYTGRNGVSADFAVSDNGQFVAFSSSSLGLVPDVEGAPGYVQVYLRDLSSEATERISIDDDSTFADYPAERPSVSGDGRYVAFVSYAYNLSTLAEGNWQVYVRDRGGASPSTHLITVSADGLAAGNSWSDNPRLSRDGKTVAFESYSTNLDASITDDSNTIFDIFVRNWLAVSPTTQLVSRVGQGTVAGDASSTMAVINDDGSTIGFVSQSTNLTSLTDTNATQDVFVSRLIALAIDSVTQDEGDSGTTSYTFTVELLSPTNQTVTVDYTTVDNSATVANSDFVAKAGSLSFAPGETLKTITILVNGDMVLEPDEVFNLVLSNVVHADILYGTGTGTIVNDDTEINVADATVIEGDSGMVQLAFEVTLVVPSRRTVTVDFATADGTATLADSDYLAATGTLSFDPGQTTKTILVDVQGDTVREQHETMLLNLSNATNALIIDGAAVGNILNDDTDASINSVSLLEGNSGTTTAQLTVTLSHPSALTVTLDYATANGTATLVDNDYQTATGTLSFAPGETTKTIDVLVSGDTTPEDYETLFVNLTNAVNAGITTGQGVVTIENDDTHISIDDVTVSELDSSSVNAVFTVMLSKASALTVSVQVDTQDMDAKAPGDYTAIVGGMVSFAPGETSKTVTVLIQGDTLDEFDEQYRVNLSTAVNGEIVDSFGLGTITDNDPPPSLSIDDVTVVEGDGGFVQAVFTVSLSAPSGKPISVAYATAGDTATAVTDFTSASGTLNFAAGVTSQQITVQIVGDLLDEFDETYFVNLTNPVNATISDGQGLGTITDNDPPPTVSIGNATVTEGDIGHVTMYFTVSLSTASGKPISVGYSTQSDSAIAGDDFVAASGTLNFASGETSQQVSVDILGDLLDEIDETFFVNLATPVNVTIDDGQGLGTITDNDPPPSLSISDASVVEGNSGTTNAVFTVTLLSASGKTVTVDYTTTNGTAVSPDDFATTSGTLTFAPGETSKQILVPVVGDTLDELTETFVVNLSNPNNATLADAQGVGTIVTDEAPKVASMVVGDGTSQRSNVTQIVVKFNSLVTIDDHLGDAISVSRLAGSYGAAGSVATTWTTSTLNGKTELLILFSGGMTRGTQKALIDGNYKLTLKAERFSLTDTPTVKLDGDNDGTGGDDYAFGSDINDKFFALYGDIDGDRDVDGMDNFVFRASYGKNPGQAGYNIAFDYNGGGVIDGIDNFFFRQRYGKSLGF